VFDRSFLYGDGVFESVRVFNGKPFCWTQHLERLRQGAVFLKIRLPLTPAALRRAADELIRRNHMPDSLLRLTLSRGVGLRGYSPKGAKQPAIVMSLHAAPVGTDVRPPSRPRRTGEDARRAGQGGGRRWKLITASPRLPAGEPLAQFKTCNKLAQILARAEADAAGADEALLVNTDGFIVEGASSNLFWVERDTVCTPPLAGGILAGVTREAVLELCWSLGVKTCEKSITAGELKRSKGVFLTLSSLGVVEAKSLDGQALPSSGLVETLQSAYGELLRVETA
jgi:branched-subunit amino acid aminotransferase/4-amino-4-deoxychorismate lyase